MGLHPRAGWTVGASVMQIVGIGDASRAHPGGESSGADEPMRYRCLSCGAPLEIEPEVTLVKCQYCHSTSRRQAGTKDHGKAILDAKRWGMGAAVLSVLTLAIVLATGVWRDEPEPVARVIPAPAPAPAPPPKIAEPEPEPAKPEPPPEPSLAAREFDPSKVLGKNEAKAVLEPALLSCMKAESVHYLIARLGQGYDTKSTGPLDPLIFVDNAWVDYREVDDLTDTTLGQCILKAAAEVTTRAQRGNYIYFGLRNPDAPDPLEGAPERIPHDEAAAALAAMDGEARECARRFPDSAPFGESLGLEVHFFGIDGTVEKIRIFYQDTQSPHTQCLIEAYSQAISPQFRSLTGSTLHHLNM